MKLSAISHQLSSVSSGSIGVLSAIIAGLLIVGCDDTPTEVESYDPQPVLSAFLTLGEPAEEVFLERVAPLYGFYDPANSGIVGADVTIFGGGDILDFVDDPNQPGRYIPTPGDTLIPRALLTYHIEVTTPPPQSEFIWAEALMPGEVEGHGPVGIVLVAPDGTVIPVSDGDTLSRDMPNMVWYWSDVDSAAGFHGLTLALTDRDSLVPLDPDWDPSEDSLEVYERERRNDQVMTAEQRSVHIIWLAFEWEGPYRVELRALSQDYTDYLFSLFRIQQGLITSTHSNIQGGGLGIFGAVSRHSQMIYMKKSSL